MSQVLFLSMHGTSFELRTPGGEPVLNPENPLLREATACKTHMDVLRFLGKCSPEVVSSLGVNFFHRHNVTEVADPDHHSIVNGKAVTHPCPVDAMRQFVKNKTSLSELGTLREIFCHLNDPEVVRETDVSFFGRKVIRFKSCSIGLNDLMHRVDRVAKDADVDYNESKADANNLRLKIAELYSACEKKLEKKNRFTRFCSWIHNRLLPRFSCDRAFQDMGHDGFRDRLGAAPASGHIVDMIGEYQPASVVPSYRVYKDQDRNPITTEEELDNAMDRIARDLSLEPRACRHLVICGDGNLEINENIPQLHAFNTVKLILVGAKLVHNPSRGSRLDEVLSAHGWNSRLSREIRTRDQQKLQTFTVVRQAASVEEALAIPLLKNERSGLPLKQVFSVPLPYL